MFSSHSSKKSATLAWPWKVWPPSAVIVAACLIAAAASAEQIEIIALEGESTPQGVIETVWDPTYAIGSTLFAGELDSGTMGALLQSRDGVLNVLFTAPHTVSGIEITRLVSIGGTDPLASISSTGDALFLAEWEPTSGGGASRGGLFLVHEDTGVVVPIALDGDMVPDGNGELVIPGLPGSVAGQNRVAFLAGVVNSVGGFGDGGGIFRSVGTGALTQIARIGQPVSASFLDAVNQPAVNAGGDVVFKGSLSGGGSGVYIGSGGSLVEVARTGEDVVPGRELLSVASVPIPINDDGVVAFIGSVDGPSTDAVMIADGTDIKIVAVEGQVPDAGPGGALSETFDPRISLNEENQVAFATSTGLYRAEEGYLLAIATAGSLVPGTTNSTFGGPPLNFAINDRGDVAFLTVFLTGGGIPTRGIFLYTATTGLLPAIVQDGSALSGALVDEIDFIGSDYNFFGPSGPTGLGDDGSVAFEFGLNNGLTGIGVFTSPVLFEDDFEGGNTLSWSVTVE